MDPSIKANVGFSCPFRRDGGNQGRQDGGQRAHLLPHSRAGQVRRCHTGQYNLAFPAKRLLIYCMYTQLINSRNNQHNRGVLNEKDKLRNVLLMFVRIHYIQWSLPITKSLGSN
ncbi:hypothetical protein AVEN_70930-1 [Araneus ventricosus]|uniref:Uncharacterized protein n=1 Tax=Araneus ventricosus TaxID=182803 RepID=A0A4Y2Q9V6_ARAVE|nr:hypothetical protein AVEN_70930-1 [Araneus ventricosus]